MAQNLNIGSKINGSLDQANNGTMEKYCYGDLEANCDVYGGLYQWNEAMQYTTISGSQWICPAGWHIPTYMEKMSLSDFLGGISLAGEKMKEAGSAHWYPPNPYGTNSSGFTGLPGGYRKLDGTFNNIALEGNFWSSSEADPDNSWEMILLWYFEEAIWDNFGKSHGFSALCLELNRPAEKDLVAIKYYVSLHSI